MRGGSSPIFASRFAKFGLELAARQDAADRVRALRRPRPRRAAARASRRRSTSWASRTCCAKTKNGRFLLKRITIAQADAGQAARGQRRAHAAPPSPDPRTGPVAGERPARPLRLLRRARQQRRASTRFRNQVTRHWLKALGAGAASAHRLTWTRMRRLTARWLPTPKRMHPFPNARFAATHPRQEPSALVPHAGICAGGRPQGRSLPRFTGRTKLTGGPGIEPGPRGPKPVCLPIRPPPKGVRARPDTTMLACPLPPC